MLEGNVWSARQQAHGAPAPQLGPGTRSQSSMPAAAHRSQAGGGRGQQAQAPSAARGVVTRDVRCSVAVTPAAYAAHLCIQERHLHGREKGGQAERLTQTSVSASLRH